MQLEVFSLCDAATGDMGKLSMLGAFDTIWAATMPIVYPQCSIALRIRFEASEQGEHQIAVKFVDADGKHIISPANGKLKVNLADDQRTGSSNLILNIHSLKIEKFGEYSIDLSIDGKGASSLPLFIKKRP